MNRLLPDNVSLRPASALDAGTTGWILHRFALYTPWMPVLYSEAETIGFCKAMIDYGWVTVAERNGRVIGFMARDGAEICSLYLAPDARGQGVGKVLLRQAKAAQPELWLRALVANTGARRFYQREGFCETDRTDGSGNDEGLPDVRMAWQAQTHPHAPQQQEPQG
ncbi:GNAT family N-acetyltransferase [Pseudophaeobacter arcticus]|uniref:GNAT family N-acetyltransferase n=2 Tax=Pseudophaeobacter arcticus TaxID=385492 RepID=UPI0024900879|nr:GNAT family N-acetyltransferase [Pseudophaeobacter arcticus]